MSGKNVGASVYQRLKNLSKERGLDMPGLLRRYAQERLLYRLSVSDHADSFCVKGGVLLSAYNAGELLRPTEDVDFNGFDREANINDLDEALREILMLPVDDDGVVFDVKSMKIEKDRTGIIPGGKIALKAMVHTAEVLVRVDVGFGNPVNPEARLIEMPTLLAGSAPRPVVLAYPLETVIAEKIHAMVQFGIANTRVKDYFDIWMLSRLHSFDGEALTAAVTETFAVQEREIPPAELDGLTPEYAEDAEEMWNSFLKRIDARSKLHFADVVADLAGMIHPVTEAARVGGVLYGTWQPGEGWIEIEPEVSPAMGR
jgi:predicted nucleotidyltransferase component of viral defense system